MANRTLSPLFQDFVTLRDAMDRLFEQSFVDPGRLLSFDGSPRSMPLEVYETPDSVVVKALVPGVTPEQLDVTYDRGTLTLRAKTEAPSAHDDWTWHLREIGYGEYSRAINLPTPVKTENAQTDFQNGVLTLRLPKVEEALPKQIRITPAKQLTSNT
ncbi:MAG: Hsp20/alpha crystallin family protein [Candidatus Limnocylindrales bacterium]